MADVVERFGKAMRKPENIRNICTSAHIHHGKCISKDSRILLENGSIITAEGLFDICKKNGILFENNEYHVIYDVSKLNLRVFSVNKDRASIEVKPVSLTWKLVGGSTIKLKLRNGLSISTTPEHKYVVYRNSEIVKVEAKDLNTNDLIACFNTEYFNFSKEDSIFMEYITKEVEIDGQIQLQKIKCDKNLLFSQVEEVNYGYEDVVYDITVEDNHNFVANGMFISNTAFTDNLLAAAGLMSEKSAGDLDKGMTTWQHADEQERLMTVDAANVSMIHEFQNQEYLINLIDTPGHVDFGGNVTRAMRAIDGTVVLVCASEGIMPQTETVLKQALRERVKPVLFINKVDRLIKEMLFTPEQMQKRFVEIIIEFNTLIEQIAEPDFKQKWKVNIQDGSVAFGSARDNWALSLPFMHKKNVNFKDILKIYDESIPEDERKKWVWDNAPLHEVILDMVIKHLPAPLDAQKCRIPKIWHGDLETEFGKDLFSGNKDGKVAFCVTRVMIDPKFGREMSAGRLFSGTIKTGMQVYLNNAKKYERVQQVLMYNGIKTQQMEEVVAGNVLAIVGISGEAGETITIEPEQPFEELKHIFEPVVTKAIEPVKSQDLAKVIEVLRTVNKEDPSIKIKINEETGECLMSGMGELHLEIVENRIVTEKGVQIKSSQPIVVYRETISRLSREVEGKSPNKHNKFYMTVEPLPEGISKAIKEGEISNGRIKKRDEALWKKLVELGWEMKEARKVVEVYKGNMVVDDTKGIVHIGEVLELVLDGIDQVLDTGPLAREPCYNLLVRIKDMKLHEDSIHRGPAQVMPAIREAVREAMADGGALILEPLQVLLLESVADHMGTISKLVASKRGQLLDMQQEGNYISVKAKLPVGEMIGLSADLRSATEGRGTFYVVEQSFEKLPYELQSKIIQQIRQRKGLSENA
ncbi:MAG TPA: elongation factor EF-2 [Candidatus Nanoarchaeia archaeon]|nr:elongation factor EF-2 [Candidatus Nanoarchaeia archaeon]